MKNELFIKALLRILILGAFFLLGYCVILLKLWDEQIREGEDHRDKVSKQSIRRIRLPSVRGRIFSSDMHLLADNVPSYDIVFHPAEMRQPGKQKKTTNHILDSATMIAGKIGRESTLTKQGVLFHINTKPALPLSVFRDLDPDEMATASELTHIQGMEIITVPKRFYPGGKLACHLIGYVGLEDPGSAEDKDFYSYYISDWKGRCGIESIYDKEVFCGPIPLRGLKGTAGNSIVRINNMGFVYETIGDPVPPQNGNDIVLTLNWRAQAIAEKLFEGKRGAFVLMEADTGAIVSMVSSPGYDLGLFIPRISKNNWNMLIKDPEKPMVNRALSGEYTPGSILKPLIALAVLENGINPLEKVNCAGSLSIGNTSVKCWSWKSGGHGEVDITGAIQGSCNVYFMTQGRRIGLEKISSMLEKAGVGRKTGFPLPERPGLLPSPEIKLQLYKEKWNVYDTSILSMGQGIILVTPLQVASYIAAIANGGTLFKPYILQEVKDSQGNTLYQSESVEKNGELDVKEEYLDIVKNGMKLVINSEHGTAKRAVNDKIELSGKTGTAEVGPPTNRKTNTWFVAFGEYGGAPYSVVVLVEEGVSGGMSCAPIVRDFFNEWLE